MGKQLSDVSRFLSYVLRHRPDAIGIALDREGWADIAALISAAVKAGQSLDRALIETVVATNDKKRFAISGDGLRIRAVQGHSAASVDIRYVQLTPPERLYHALPGIDPQRGAAPRHTPVCASVARPTNRCLRRAALR